MKTVELNEASKISGRVHLGEPIQITCEGEYIEVIPVASDHLMCLECPVLKAFGKCSTVCVDIVARSCRPFRLIAIDTLLEEL